MIQKSGAKYDHSPETLNITSPELIASFHRAYIDAGADVVYTNTFGANSYKLGGSGHSVEEIVSAAVGIAKNAAGGAALVALDIGPVGMLCEPAGTMTFEQAYGFFKEQIEAGCDADLIVFETMTDLLELKAAILAAKENSDKPIIATMTFERDGRTFTGVSPAAFALTASGLGVDALGVNCSLGPDELEPVVAELTRYTDLPLVVKANAGLPDPNSNEYNILPDRFAECVEALLPYGVKIAGGCCGTTPGYIGKLREMLADKRYTPSPRTADTSVCSASRVVEINAPRIIGERINPTGKKLLKEAYLRGDTAYVLREAVKQIDAGAEMLDVNCGVPGIDEAATLERTVETVQSVVTCPIQIDTADPVALERALVKVNGKPLVNSVNGKRESMDAVFPLVKKYGGAIVALCLDETGIPPTSDGRIAIARRILDEGAKYGFSRKDFVFDALTLAVSADPQAAVVTLETVRRLTEELGVNTVLGVSNVSFGLPDRPALNNAMYSLAKRAGLSAAIANPSLIRDELDPAAEDVLLARDRNCERWIAAHASGGGAKPQDAPAAGASGPDALAAAIRRGLRDDAAVAAKAMLASGATAMDVIEKGIVPALEQVGNAFEKGTAFLPQLLMAADAAGDAFAVVRKTGLAGVRKSDGQGSQAVRRRPIVIATVKGDIHDIGKNIVRALLENYGFDVIDLGRDVPPETIVERARAANAGMIGLSALMTTTVGAMAETVRLVKEAGLDAKTFVGGAVVTQEYADSIGADFYSKDAMQAVRLAERILRV